MPKIPLSSSGLTGRSSTPRTFAFMPSRLRLLDTRVRGMTTGAPMFDLRQLERAQGIVGAAMPPTPAHAWPLLSERLGATAIVKHENHTPTGAFKVRGGLVYVDRLKRERPRHRRADLGDARQSRPEPRLRGEPLWRAGDDLRAARQFGREEPRDAGVRRQRWSSTARIFRPRARKPSAAPGSTDSNSCRPSIPIW